MEASSLTNHKSRRRLNAEHLLRFLPNTTLANGAECTEPTWRKAILTFIGSFFSILDRYLVEVDERAVSMLEQLTAQMARQEGVTEWMKAEEPMAWVSRMNGIRGRAEEIIRENVINGL